MAWEIMRSVSENSPVGRSLCGWSRWCVLTLKRFGRKHTIIFLSLRNCANVCLKTGNTPTGLLLGSLVLSSNTPGHPSLVFTSFTPSSWSHHIPLRNKRACTLQLGLQHMSRHDIHQNQLIVLQGNQGKKHALIRPRFVLDELKRKPLRFKGW